MRDTKIKRCMRIGLGGFAVTALLGLGFSTTALADISPPGCTANVFSVDVGKNKTQVVSGDTVTYTVNVENEGANGCDVNEVTLDFFCPASDGLPAATPTYNDFVANQSYDVGTLPTLVGEFDCVMPTFNQGVAFAQAEVSGTGNLRDAVNPDPQTISKTVSVAVLGCDVQIDKQISCDGINWTDSLNAAGDPQYAPDGTPGCSTLEQNAVKVRWYIKGNGTADLSQCTFTESNGAWGGPVGLTQPFDLLAGDEVIYEGTLQPLCIDAKPGEPNTAAVSCAVCGGVTQPEPITDSDDATLDCLATSVKVDKQLDCGAGFVDNYGLTADNDADNAQSAGDCIAPANCQTQGCEAPLTGPVTAYYRGQNTGEATLYACELVDSNTVFDDVSPQIGTLAPDQIKTFAQTPPDPLCQDVDDLEPDTLTLTCCVDDVALLSACGENRTVQALDMATVQCLSPGLNVTKACEAGTLEENLVAITVTNTGEVPLANCVATDTYYPEDPSCDVTGLPDSSASETGTPTDLPLGLLPTPLAVDQVATLQTTIPVGESDLCNTVMVTCDVVGTETEITKYAKAECPGTPEGCLTRTPGFWGTHPFIIEDRVGSINPKTGEDRSLDLLPLSVCGVVLDTTAAVAKATKKPVCDYSGHSTSEAICSVGSDHKCLNSDDNLTQLVRQCTAAKLNVAASQALEGSCANIMDIGATIAGCCETADTCATGANDYTVSWCIGALDAFNNWDMDGLNFPFSTGPADSSQCKAAKNNGVVVSP